MPFVSMKFFILNDFASVAHIVADVDSSDSELNHRSDGPISVVNLDQRRTERCMYKVTVKRYVMNAVKWCELSINLRAVWRRVIV